MGNDYTLIELASLIRDDDRLIGERQKEADARRLNRALAECERDLQIESVRRWAIASGDFQAQSIDHMRCEAAAGRNVDAASDETKAEIARQIAVMRERKAALIEAAPVTRRRRFASTIAAQTTAVSARTERLAA